MDFPHHTDKPSRSHGIRSTATIALLFTLSLAACNVPQTPRSTAAEALPTTSTKAVGQTGTAHVTSPFAPTSGGAAAAMASVNDFDALLARYPEAKRARIKAWYEKHAVGSMAFTSNAQWQWMRQRNYPTPADVLHASTMSATQLRELAVHGDTKANFFYLARLLDDVAQTGGLSVLANGKNARAQAELTWSMDHALASGSAFAGYMFADYYLALHGKSAAGIGMAAGLTWAGSFGDSNSLFHSQSRLMGFPGVSGVRAAEAYFDMFAAAARVNSYLLNARHGKGKSSIPLQ